MSGPVRRVDIGLEDGPLDRIVTRQGRAAEVGGLGILRVLPTKGRRTVGAWCFVDLMGPADAEEPHPMEVGPHPHIGLSTVTWLLEGEALHTDSLGSEQVIRPGQLNWMTAGHGIAHAELAARPPFRGAQMWVAQPEDTRHGPSSFQHHADLPTVEIGGAVGTVFAGSFHGLDSPARADTPLVGVDLRLTAVPTALSVEPGWEHAVVPLDGPVRVGEEVAEPGWLALIPPGVDELPLQAAPPGGRVLLIGGEPFERVAMWWNFVARDRDELEAAWRDWRGRTDRFGPVPSASERIEAPIPHWVGEDS
jgi:quercetin 2,3-dioxygenase